jgi:hypothetical protein
MCAGVTTNRSTISAMSSQLEAFSFGFPIPEDSMGSQKYMQSMFAADVVDRLIVPWLHKHCYIH